MHDDGVSRDLAGLRVVETMKQIRDFSRWTLNRFGRCEISCEPMQDGRETFQHDLDGCLFTNNWNSPGLASCDEIESVAEDQLSLYENDWSYCATKI